MLETDRVVGATVYGSCKVGSDPGTENRGMLANDADGGKVLGPNQGVMG